MLCLLVVLIPILLAGLLLLRTVFSVSLAVGCSQLAWGGHPWEKLCSEFEGPEFHLPSTPSVSALLLRSGASYDSSLDGGPASLARSLAENTPSPSSSHLTIS